MPKYTSLTGLLNLPKPEEVALANPEVRAEQDTLIDAWQSFSATIVHTGEHDASGQTSEVAIVSTENGQSITDACYVLVDFSSEGCDENGDGKITFQDIPLGTYIVHQTANLGSGRFVRDFTIFVTGDASGDGWERFNATVSTSGSDAAGSTAPVDIARIIRDPQDGHLLTGTCYVLVGYSNEGCDENGDGQVTFAAIPPGTYTVRQTLTPAGYPTINDYDITIENQSGVPLGFIVKQAVEQNAPNTRNVSVVFVDSRKYTKISSSICVQFVGASNVGCDEDLLDGQIDFLDVPAGRYEVKYSNLPEGWQIMGQDMVRSDRDHRRRLRRANGPDHLRRGVCTGLRERGYREYRWEPRNGGIRIE